MRTYAIAGLASLAALGAHAQVGSLASTPLQLESLVVTATRSLTAEPTLRDTVVITRAQIEDAGPLSLGEPPQQRRSVRLDLGRFFAKQPRHLKEVSLRMKLVERA